MSTTRATRFWRRIDVRVAAAAGLIAAVVLVSGVQWVRAELHRQQLATNQLIAQTEAGTLLARAPQWGGMSGVLYDWLPYQLYRNDGTLIAENNMDQLRSKGWTQPLPDPTALPPAGTVMRMDNGTAIYEGSGTVTLNPTGSRDQILVSADWDGYHVYVYVTPHAAEWPVVPVDQYLWWGAALAWLLVTATAAVTVRLALRPVEAMRREAARITSSPDESRLSAKPRHDELGVLAATLDTMLGRLGDSFRSQQRFTADAAHELRGPLASLRAAVEIALAHPDDVAADETLRHVLAETDRLQDLAEHLLTVSRARSAPALPGAVSDPVAAIEQVLAGYPAHDTGRVRVVDNRTAPRPASIPPPDLHRVLRNLLDNALRHAATGVQVDIEDTGPDLVALTVTNDGAPIPDDERERIFQPFVRLDDARSRDDGGTGLGLTIVRSLIEHAGGTVTAASSNSATTFTVQLPSIPACPEGETPSQTDAVAQGVASDDPLPVLTNAAGADH